ncbi:hypothetical protein STRDD11_01256 [Streptococcus sp. DD11]|uniref:TipC family immunity protein n=1 Tax=Streptococcus sp. DD11 TaxID=1777879 RepID=UPI00079B4315|nr:TipC family immunity protein [Streptococcus sp. DD11]KXT83859.1 hypothetical protein STRDD11_01256 [Streptococcus sp. DD11]
MKVRLKTMVLLCLAASIIVTLGVVASKFDWNFNQPKNIFAEMYGNVANRSGGTPYNRVRNKVDFKTFRAFDKDMNETRDLNTRIAYKKVAYPNSYTDIELTFYGHENILSISAKRPVDNDVRIEISGIYDTRKKIFRKKVYVITGTSDKETFIDNESQIQSYLNEYHIGANDLDSFYQETINNTVLKDWAEIYNSKFSPEDYGEVKIETQWAGW